MSPLALPATVDEAVDEHAQLHMACAPGADLVRFYQLEQALQAELVWGMAYTVIASKRLLAQDINNACVIACGEGALDESHLIPCSSADALEEVISIVGDQYRSVLRVGDADGELVVPEKIQSLPLMPSGTSVILNLLREFDPPHIGSPDDE